MHIIQKSETKWQKRRLWQKTKKTRQLST